MRENDRITKNFHRYRYLHWRVQKYAAAIPKLKFSILFSLVYTMAKLITFHVCLRELLL